MANVSSSNGLEKRPKLRFPGFEGAWDSVQLSDIASYRRSRKTAVKSEYVSTENMLQGFSGMEAYCDSSVIEGIAYFTGDTLIANIRPYLKKVWFATMNGVCSADVLAIQPIKVYPEFLYNMIAQDAFIEYVMSGTKGSKMPRGDKSHIMDYKTAIPKCDDEQIKIAQFLHLLTLRISKTQLLIDFLKKYKRGLSSSLFDEISKSGCQTVLFADGFRLLQNNTFSRDDLSYHVGDVRNIHYGDVLVKYGTITDIGVLSVPFIKPDRDIEKFSASSYLRNGDIIIADTAEDYTVGKATEIAGVTNQQVLSGLHTIPCRPHDRFAPMFLGYYFNSYHFRRQIYRMIQGIKVSSISKSEIVKTTILTPPYDVQHKVASVLSKVDHLIGKEAETAIVLQKIRRGLLQQLFI